MPETRSRGGVLSTLEASQWAVAQQQVHRRNPLEPSAYELRRDQNASKPSSFLQGCKAVRFPTADIHRVRFKRAMDASNASRACSDIESVQGDCDEPSSPVEIDLRSRRHAIFHLFLSLGRPGASNWNGRGGTVATIAESLNIPKGSRKNIAKLLAEIVDKGNNFDPDTTKAKGKEWAIKEGTEEARIVFDALETGIGRAESAVLVREYRIRHGLPRANVSYSAVQNFAARSELVETSRRTTKKAGSGPDSKWALASLAQARQFLAQLDPASELPLGCRRVNIEAVIFCDEHHKKTVLGCASKLEDRIARHPGMCFYAV